MDCPQHHQHPGQVPLVQCQWLRLCVCCEHMGCTCPSGRLCDEGLCGIQGQGKHGPQNWLSCRAHIFFCPCLRCILSQLHSRDADFLQAIAMPTVQHPMHPSYTVPMSEPQSSVHTFLLVFAQVARGDTISTSPNMKRKVQQHSRPGKAKKPRTQQPKAQQAEA